MIDRLTASDDAAFLTVTWEDGQQSTLSAATLRREARDAWTRRELIDTGTVQVAADLRITELQQIGAGGVNVHFSDGHDRAIYPFQYLRELSERFDN